MKLISAYYHDTRAVNFVAVIFPSMLLVAWIASVIAGYVTPELIDMPTLMGVLLAIALVWVFLVVVLGDGADFAAWLRSRPGARARQAEDVIVRMRELAPNPETVDLSLYLKLVEFKRVLSSTLGRSMLHRVATTRLLSADTQKYYNAMLLRVDDMWQLTESIERVESFVRRIHEKLKTLHEENRGKDFPWDDLKTQFFFPQCARPVVQQHWSWILKHPECLSDAARNQLKEVVGIATDATYKWYESRERIIKARSTLRRLGVGVGIGKPALNKVLGRNSSERGMESLTLSRTHWQSWVSARQGLAESDPFRWMLEWINELGSGNMS